MGLLTSPSSRIPGLPLAALQFSAISQGITEPSVQIGIRERGLACPANSVPVVVRHTGMEGATNGPREEAHTGADCERSAAD